MSRMRRTLASVVAGLAVAGTGPARTAPPRWQVDGGERYCTVIRAPAAADEPTLVIRNNLYGLGADLLFSSPALPSVNGPVRVVTELGESPPLRAATSARPDGSTLLQVQHLGAAGAWLRLEEARSVAVHRGDRVVVRVPLALPPAVVRAVRACQAQAMADAGFGPEIVEEARAAPGAAGDAARSGTAAPLSDGNPAAWLSDADYPAAARRDGRGGTVGVLLRVEPDGSVGRCFVGLTSGSPDLDDATCRAVSARGRWAPVDGRPRLSRLYFSWSPS